MAEDYKVGYRKPPKDTQFKKGRSGNPKGRPKGRKNMRTIVKSILDRTITITENGRTRRVKFLDAFAHQMAAKALNGSTRDQIMLLKAMHDFAPELLKGPIERKLVDVRFIDARDGRPIPYDEFINSGGEVKDSDDLSFLD